MSLFGKKKTATKKKVAKKAPVKAKKASKGSSDAKAILAKLQAKQDAGDCPFC